LEDRPLGTRVILVRHGESSFNVERRVQGHLDQSLLTDQGVADAVKVGVALQGLSFDAIYTSPLGRTQQTGQVIREQLTSPPHAQILETLKEVGLPLWEGLLFSDVQRQFPEQYEQWHKAPHTLKMLVPTEAGTAEVFPIHNIFEQAQQAWAELLPRHPDQTLLLVGHSGINRALLATALGLSPERYQMLQQANCNISIVNFPDGTLESAQLEGMNLTAHMGVPLPAPRPGYKALRLLLVRHGETNWNRDGRFQGQRDIPLNENGQKQGQRASEFLKDIQIDFAVSSPMARPKETAELILASHPDVSIGFDERLCEISHGSWEGCLESEIESGYPGELDRWRTQPESVQMPEGENLQQVWDRANRAWETIIQQGLMSRNNDSDMPVGLVVAHDAVNKVILCKTVGSTPGKFWNFKQGNGAVSVIDFSPEGLPTLQSMNITTHLEGGILDQTASGAL
jgi:phosphoserine phosphatase